MDCAGDSGRRGLVVVVREEASREEDVATLPAAATIGPVHEPMETSEMADIFDRMTARDVAMAAAAANRIMMENLFAAGVLDRATVEKAFHGKAQELLTKQFEDRAGQLLMMMGGAVRRADE